MLFQVAVAVVAVLMPHAVPTTLRFWSLCSDVTWSVFLRFGLVNAAGSLVGALIHSKVNSPVLG